MAVRVNNTASIRKAKRWTEKDDAALCVLLKRKIKEVRIALRESDSPYARARLKEQKRRYKSMLEKVERGVYNGDIIFAELQAAYALQSEQNVRSAVYATTTGAKRYNNSYANMDFDYETAFRKKRYYGVGLPVILLVLSILFVFIFVMGAFLPASISSAAEGKGVSLGSLFCYKLDDSFDLTIKNDGKWPGGTYADAYIDKAPKQGEPFVDSQGNTPDIVMLHEDLGMTTVYISPYDIIKAWFRTPMLKNVRLDFLEDNELFQGDSFYYLCFLDGKSASLKIQKDADGNFDRSVIFRHIGTYGTIIFLIISFILGIVSVIINIVRLFTYTSRRIHVITILSFLSSLFLMLCPAFAIVEGTDIGGAFSTYFASMFNMKGFLANPESTAGIGLLMLVPVVINLVMLIIPLLFKNKLKRRPTYVPAGNKPRRAIDDPFYTSEENLRGLV